MALGWTGTMHHACPMATRGPYESRPHVTHPKSLGERIRAVRLAWGWTQGQFAAALNTDFSAISSWERERVRPSGAALAALCHLLRLSPEWLEGAQEFVIPPPPGEAQAATARTLTLPDMNQAPVCLLTLQDATGVPLQDPTQAVMRLLQAVQEGRKVWVVLE